MWFHRIIVVILTLSPSVAKAVHVDWQEKYIAANFVTTVVYEGPPLPSGQPGSRSTVFAPRSTVSSNSYRTSFKRQVAMWDGLALGQADFVYGLGENGSGWATIRYTATAESINNSTTGVTTDTSVGGYAGLGASLSFIFETTENANFDYVTARRVTPFIGSPYLPNHAGTIVSRGGSAWEVSDEGQMIFGISSESGYPLSEIYQYHPLSPGRYFLGFSGAATVASAYAAGTPSQRFEASGEYTVMWSFGGQFPGATPNTAITAAQFIDLDDEPPPGADPDTIAGVKLTFPTFGEIGHTGDAFVGLSTRVQGGVSAGALVTGFKISSEDAPLTSVIVPALPSGAEMLTIDFGTGPQSVVAGQTVDFGSAGIQSFKLAGFDPDFSSAELDAFVMGLRFAEEGLASLIASPVLYIPPGDFSKNGIVDGGDYVAWRKGLEAGNYTETDYALWRANFGAPLNSAGGNAGELAGSVPEPSTALLLLVAAAMCGRRRR